MEKGPNAGMRLSLASESQTIGRDPESDIFLDDITVSRKHAIITKDPRSYRVQDAGSLNGTYLNGERVTEHELRSGDRIWIGRYRLLFLGST